jgi:hypothetical protein
VPQCKRACEQVARCWADASLEDIAINGTPIVATRMALKIKRVMTSFSLRQAHSHSRRLLFANAAIAAWRDHLWPCVGVRSSWWPNARVHIHGDATSAASVFMMRPTTTP